jgi:hypothetical protein
MFKEIDYNKHFVIGTPLVGWKADMKEEMEWINNAQNILNKFDSMERKLDINIDNVIDKLLSVRTSKVPKQVNLL